MIRPILCLAFAVTAGTGCTNLSHQRATVGQSSTLDQLYRQQVADNLAKFTRDPNALPHFSFPSQGATSVNDNGTFGAGFTFNPFGLTEYALSPGVTRDLSVSWTMEPVSDPAKLGRMRVLYQQAVASAWYSHGCRRDVPHQKCILVGRHCETYVWVTPDCGSDELTKLTLAIMDAALNDPPAPAAQPTRTVEVLKEYAAATNTYKRKETFEELIDDKSTKAVPNPVVQSQAVPTPGPNATRSTGPLGFRQSLDTLTRPVRRR